MDPEKIKAAIDALKNEDGAAALALLEEMIAGAPAPEGEALGGNAETPPAPADQAALAALCTLTGAPTAAEAVSRFRNVLEQVQTLAADRAAVDLVERRSLIAELVTFGVEFPATAWEGNADEQKPCKRLADEPIAELRARVALHRAKRPAGSRGVTPPGTATPATLTPAQQATCKKLGITPEEFIARKAGAVRTHTRSDSQ
jgi:hypothetical protein